MKIKYPVTYKRVHFSTLKVGDMFRAEDNDGLFIKIKPRADPTDCPGGYAQAVVIDPISGAGCVPAGRFTDWGHMEYVIPVTEISIELAR